MKVDILAVGKNMPAWVTAGIKEYLPRFPAQFKLDLIEISPALRSKNGIVQAYKSEESIAILNKIPLNNFVIALDVKGKSFDTPQLAVHLQQWMSLGKNISFIIGGPDGLDDNSLQRADLLWSLSPLTFPHPLVRIILIEQLYRAWSILNHHPYHRI